jgi:hypothetical protein
MPIETGDKKLEGIERDNAPWLIYGAVQLVRPDPAELKTEVQVSLQTLRNWGSGQGMPTVKRVKALVEFFKRRGVTLDLKKGTLTFSIADAVAGGVEPRKPTGRNTS